MNTFPNLSKQQGHLEFFAYGFEVVCDFAMYANKEREGERERIVKPELLTQKRDFISRDKRFI